MIASNRRQFLAVSASNQAPFKNGRVEMTDAWEMDADHLKSLADAKERLRGTHPCVFAVSRLLGGIIATPSKGTESTSSLLCISTWVCLADSGCSATGGKQSRGSRRLMPATSSGKARLCRRCGSTVRAQRGMSWDWRGHANSLHQTGQRCRSNAPLPSLDWDVWRGDAPKFPCAPEVGRFNWHSEKNSGHGRLVDRGARDGDARRVIPRERAPCRAATAGGHYPSRGRTALWSHAKQA